MTKTPKLPVEYRWLIYCSQIIYFAATLTAVLFPGLVSSMGLDSLLVYIKNDLQSAGYQNARLQGGRDFADRFFVMHAMSLAIVSVSIVFGCSFCILTNFIDKFILSDFYFSKKKQIMNLMKFSISFDVDLLFIAFLIALLGGFIIFSPYWIEDNSKFPPNNFSIFLCMAFWVMFIHGFNLLFLLLTCRVCIDRKD